MGYIPGETKVCQFWLIAFEEEDVFQFNVIMSESLAVAILQGLGNFQKLVSEETDIYSFGVEL